MDVNKTAILKKLVNGVREAAAYAEDATEQIRARTEVGDLAQKFEDYGCESIIYTDIGRDGMLQGINIEATVRLARAVKIPVIASGGLSNLADIESLCEVEDEGIEGVICGRAIYSGDLDFAKAQARADELNGAA